MTPNYVKRDVTFFIVVHCADTGPNQDVGAAEIRKWHVEERGWIDIGYHKVIKRDGTVEDGRPLWAMGAHVEGWNHCTVGVCLVGGNDGHQGHEQNNFTPEQMESLEKVIRAIKLLYPKTVVVGHRDFPNVPKYCPSFDASSWWHKLNAA